MELTGQTNTQFSPYLNGALEDLQHARELVSRGRPIDCKYAIISAANSVENALKEKVRILGPQTLNERAPYNQLGYQESLILLKQKNVRIPLETESKMLQRLRNDCVHRSYKPDTQTTLWYVDIAKKFVEEFCLKEFGIDVREHEEKVLELTPQSLEGLHHSNSVKAIQEGRFLDAILSAGILLDLLLGDYAVSKGLNRKYAKRQSLIEFIRKKSKDLPEELVKSISRVRVIRGEAVKGKSLPTKEDAWFVMETVNAISQQLSKMWTSEKRCFICGNANIVLERMEKDGKVVKFYCESHSGQEK